MAGADDDAQTVLTWPEGNGWIVTQLKAPPDLARSMLGALAWRVRPDGERRARRCVRPCTQRASGASRRAPILAAPRFVADRLLGRAPDGAHSYAPWMVANVTVGRLPAGRGAPLCWDNVIRDSASLGYVVATHQSLRPQVQTHRADLLLAADATAPPADARRDALAAACADWQAMVLRELLRVHPELDGASSGWTSGSGAMA